MTEFLLKMGLTSKNEKKVVYAVIAITYVLKQKQITPIYMLATTLILINHESRLVRTHALNLLECLSS